MIKKLLIFLFFSPLFAGSFQDFEAYQHTLNREIVRHRIQNYLQKDPEIADHYTLKDDKLELFASLQDKKNASPEFTLYFGNKPKPTNIYPRSTDPDKPLQGWKIALDPGHIGGAFSRLEERYIDMLPSKQIEFRTDIQFNESHLAILTAKLLKKLLEERGAEVWMTREEEGKGCFSEEYDTFLSNNYAYVLDTLVAYYPPSQQKAMRLFWQNKATPSEIFRLSYNFIDLEERARLINAYNPHLTVCIHYNLGGEYDANKKNTGTSHNYSMVFVPGGFRKLIPYSEGFSRKSLVNKEARYAFIRLLVTDDIEDSISLGKYAITAFNKYLGIPTASKSDAKYLDVLCIEASRGVYHRNLTLLRLVKGAILYGEPLCQDNYFEALRLSQKNIFIGKERAPKRLEDVAHAYLEAILNWSASYR